MALYSSSWRWLSSRTTYFQARRLLTSSYSPSQVLSKLDGKQILFAQRVVGRANVKSETYSFLGLVQPFTHVSTRNISLSPIASTTESPVSQEKEEQEAVPSSASSRLVFKKQRLAFSVAKKEEINQDLYEKIKAGQWDEVVELVQNDSVLNHITLKNLRQVARHLSSVGQAEQVSNLYLRFYQLRTIPNFPQTDLLLWFESTLETDPKAALRLIQNFRIFRTCTVFEKFYGYLIRKEIPHRVQFLISALNCIATSSRSTLSHDHLRATCDFVANYGKPKELLVLFHTLYNKGFILSEHMYEQIMQAAFVARDYKAAVDILEKMKRDLNFVDSVHVALVIATFGRQGLYKEALEFLSKYQAKSPIYKENGAIETALAFAYAQGGELNLAVETIERALSKQLQLDVNLFVNLLFSVGFTKNESTLLHLLEIGRLHASSEHVYSFYEWSLRGIAKTGDFQLFQRILSDMKRHHVPMTNELFVLQVRVACGAVRQQDKDAIAFLKEPLGIIEQVESQGLQVTPKLIEALIVSCCWSGNTTAPIVLLEELKKRFGDYTHVGLLQYQRVCKHLSLTPEQKYIEALDRFQSS